MFVLVIAFGGRKLGLAVDSLEGEEELVIKALDDQTVTTDLVSGGSILGDGRVVLIMNLAGIVDRFSKSRSGETRSAGCLRTVAFECGAEQNLRRREGLANDMTSQYESWSWMIPL